jgi:hypothetical protein
VVCGHYSVDLVTTCGLEMEQPIASVFNGLIPDTNIAVDRFMSLPPSTAMIFLTHFHAGVADQFCSVSSINSSIF